MPAEWGKVRAEEILSQTGGVLVSGDPGRIFAGLSTDSRAIAPGDLFWALKGERYDGHDFVDKALEQGALGAIVDKASVGRLKKPPSGVIIAVEDTLRALGDFAHWWREQHRVSVVAITGSAGKTTTKEMTASILEKGHGTLKTQGNQNNLIGVPLTLFRLGPAHHMAVVEMGMNRAGEIARLTEIAAPDVGVVTNVGRAHLEGLGSLEGIARAKVELLEKMGDAGIAVVNGDDALLMKTAIPMGRTLITFGTTRERDVQGRKIAVRGLEGSSFDLFYRGEGWPVRLKVPGRQNVHNALAAAAAAFCLRQPPESVVKGLESFEGIAGRFQVIPMVGGGALVDDTYNANPASLNAAVDSVTALVPKGGRLIIGLADMLELGTESAEAHLEAGRLAAKTRPSLFLVMGDHAPEMAEGARQGGLDPSRVVRATNPTEMGEKIMMEMKRGDVILLKGSRRMRLDQVVHQVRSDHGKRVDSGRAAAE